MSLSFGPIDVLQYGSFYRKQEHACGGDLGPAPETAGIIYLREGGSGVSRASHKTIKAVILGFQKMKLKDKLIWVQKKSLEIHAVSMIGFLSFHKLSEVTSYSRKQSKNVG